MNKYSDFYKYQICLQFLRTEKQMSPERNGFIKCLTRPNEEIKKTKYAIAYYTYMY